MSNETATAAPPNDQQDFPMKKHNRHVAIALNHMNKRREALIAKRDTITKEIEELDTAILVLD